MKKLDKMSRTCGYLEKIFNHLNLRYFENALTMPIITVMSTPNLNAPAGAELFSGIVSLIKAIMKSNNH